MNNTIVFSNGLILGVDCNSNISIVGGIQVKEYDKGKVISDKRKA